MSKRKREPDQPRVAFHAADRSWERILQEDSLDDLKNVVAKRLELPAASSVKMWRLTDGKRFELFEDDDFDAFYAALLEKHVMHVEVQVVESLAPHNVTSASPLVLDQSVQSGASSEPDGPPQKKRKTAGRKPQVSSSEAHPPVDEDASVEPTADHPPLNITDDEVTPAPVKKKRRTRKPAPEPETEPQVPEEENDHRQREFMAGLVDAYADIAATATAEPSEDPTRPSNEPSEQGETETPHPKRKRRKIVKTDISPIEGQPIPTTLSDPDGGPAEAPPKKKRRKPRTPGAASETETEAEDNPSSSRPKRIAQKLLQRMEDARAAQSVEAEPKKETKKRKRQKLQKAEEEAEVEAAPVPSTDTANEMSPPPIPASTAPSKSKKKKLESPLVQLEPPEELFKPGRASKTLPIPSDPSPSTSTSSTIVENLDLSAAKPPHRSVSKSTNAVVDPEGRCPVCSKSPMHLRYNCPTIKKGPIAIHNRIVDLGQAPGNAALVQELRAIVKNLSSPPAEQVAMTPPRHNLRGTARKPLTNGIPGPLSQSQVPSITVPVIPDLPSEDKDEESSPEPTVVLEGDDDDKPRRPRGQPQRSRRSRARAARDSSEEQESGDEDEPRILSSQPPRISVVSPTSELPSVTGPSFGSLNHDTGSERPDDQTGDEAARLVLKKDVSYSPVEERPKVLPVHAAREVDPPTIEREPSPQSMDTDAVIEEGGNPEHGHDSDPIVPASQPTRRSRPTSNKFTIPPPRSPTPSRRFRMKDRLGFTTPLSELTSKALTQFQIRPHDDRPKPSRVSASPFAISMPTPSPEHGKLDAPSRDTTPPAEQAQDLAQPNDLDLQMRLSEADAEPSQPSLTQWTTLPGGTTISEPGDSQSVGQVDELYPSSSPRSSPSQDPPSSPVPSRHRRSSFGAGLKFTPLFLDGDEPDTRDFAQDQYQESSQAYPPIPALELKMRVGSDNSSDEAREVEKAMNGGLALSLPAASVSTRRPPMPALPPSLKDLRGRSFASPKIIPSSQPVRSTFEYDGYGRRKGGQDSSDDDEDDDEQEHSHIPKTRRAGKLKGGLGKKGLA